MNENRADLFPVCQASHDRIESDPRAREQWQRLIAELFIVFGNQLQPSRGMASCIGCVDHDVTARVTTGR